MSQELSLSDFPEEIQKSFSNNDLEKATYKNNAQNRKLGRVGKEIKRTSSDSSSYSKLNIDQMRKYLSDKYGSDAKIGDIDAKEFSHYEKLLVNKVEVI